MALFRKFFYRKLEISERVYAFDCCFTTKVLRGDENEVYIVRMVDQLREYFPDASFIVFSFGDGEYHTEITAVLSKHDITVVDYPSQNGNCPVRTMEMIHHFLRSSESWLCIGQKNVLLMHCQNGAFPVLAFMLSAFLIYRKLYTGEKKTLDMLYKQEPQEIVHLVMPIDPFPSQLRYLQYVSRRSIGTHWPPFDRVFMLDCVILRDIPNIDGKGGCRPIFRVYGPDPLMAADPKTKLLFSMPRKSKAVGYFKQADCKLVKIGINCHVQGDVVIECITFFFFFLREIECITLSDNLDEEEMMFRVMFITALVRSNMVMLNRDEIDTLRDIKDLFPEDFIAEVVFSDMDSTSAFFMLDSTLASDVEGLPIEAFSQVHDIFYNHDQEDTDLHNALAIIQQMTVSSILEEKLDFTGFPSNRKENWQNVPDAVKLVDDVGESLEGFNAAPLSGEFLKSEAHSPATELTEMLSASLKSSPELSSATKKIDPFELHVSVQRPAHSKIISPRISQTSPSNQGSYGSSSQGSPVTLTRYHCAPLSAVGITALLQDHAEFSGNKVSLLAPESSMSAATPTDSCESLKSGLQAVSAPPPPPLPPPSRSSSDLFVCPQPPPPAPPLQPSIRTAKPPSPPPPPSSTNVTIVKNSSNPIPPPTLSQGATAHPPQHAGTMKELTAKGVPPPPAPLLNASSKSGDTSSPLLSSAGSQLGGKAKFQLRTSTKAQATSKRSSLKPYHWLKLTRAMQGSLWAEAQKPEEASKAPELDLSEIERLFSANISNPDGGPGRKTNMLGSTVKTEKVHLIELRRAYNCEIMLTKVKIPVSDLIF